MIDFLKGRLEEVFEGRLILSLLGGQVGLEVGVSRYTLSFLPPKGTEVCLFVHEIVKEEGWQLFGFLEAGERQIFRLLLRVNGLGPRHALAILSSSSPMGVTQALLSGDVPFLTQVPGIGKKMAERILLELKGPVSKLDLVPDETSPTNGTLSEILLALKGLGFSHAEALKACKDALSEVPNVSLEEGLLHALRHLRH